MTKAQKLATIKHYLTCRWNHEDGCGWYYDRGEWTESTRVSYLKDADSEAWRFNEATLDFYLLTIEHFQRTESERYDMKKIMLKSLEIK